MHHHIMHLRTFQAAATAALLLLLAAGCATKKSVPREVYKPHYTPQNVAGDPAIPAAVRRVVMLPVFYGADPSDSFVTELDRLFQSELGRSGSLEVVPITRERLKALFGFDQVESVDLLPNNFLDRLRAAYGADAVVLTDLTVNQPYRPMALGIRCKMVDLQSGRIFWAIDTVFDSADPAVAAAARHFAGLATYSPYPLDTSHAILQSPRKFADFVAWSVFRTLPPRV